MQPSGSRRRLRNALLAVTLLLGGSAAAFATFEPVGLAAFASGETPATETPPPRATAAEPVAAEVEPRPLTEEQKCVEATVAYGYVWADYESAKITRYFLFGQEVSEYEHFRYRQQGNTADPSRSAATQRAEFDPQWKARLAAVPQLHPLSDSGQEMHLGKLLSASGSESTYVTQAETLCRQAYAGRSSEPQAISQPLELPPAAYVPPPDADTNPPAGVALDASQQEGCTALEQVFREWLSNEIEADEARRRMGEHAAAFDSAMNEMGEPTGEPEDEAYGLAGVRKYCAEHLG